MKTEGVSCTHKVNINCATLKFFDVEIEGRRASEVCAPPWK